MASKISPIRTIAGFVQPARRRAPRFLSCHSQCQSNSRRRISSTHTPNEQQTAPASTARWQQTPPAMKAPVRLRENINKVAFPVNNNPGVLDNFYTRMLGEGGEKLLSEEVKWQAVTHKSFDQGRRGFNDRLAYLGKQVVMLQASLALLQNSAAHAKPLRPDPHGRRPQESPVLEGIEVLSQTTRAQLMKRKEMSGLAQQYGIANVLRWVPKKQNDLTESGVDTVYMHAMYAVIGAIALENGSQVANELTRERILKPLGFHLD